MQDKAIMDGAKAIAASLQGPGGQIKLSKVVADYLPWFDLARERGMSWDQMIRVLANAGATRESGLQFTRGHLSSAVWRARQQGASAASTIPIIVRTGSTLRARSQQRHVKRVHKRMLRETVTSQSKRSSQPFLARRKISEPI